MKERIQEILKALNSELSNLQEGERIKAILCNSNRETYSIYMSKDTQISSCTLEKITTEEVQLKDQAF